MNKPANPGSRIDMLHCRECGAENVLPASKCWLCYRPLGGGDDVVMAEVVGRPPPRPETAASQWIFGTMTIGAIVLAILVGIGLAMQEGEMAIGYGILVTPALAATLISALRHRDAAGQVSWGRAFTTLLITFTITVGVVSALILAAIIALMVICFRTLAGGH